MSWFVYMTQKLLIVMLFVAIAVSGVVGQHNADRATEQAIRDHNSHAEKVIEERAELPINWPTFKSHAGQYKDSCIDIPKGMNTIEEWPAAYPNVLVVDLNGKPHVYDPKKAAEKTQDNPDYWYIGLCK